MFPINPLFGDLIEDRLLAETFERFGKTKDPSWPIIFPMVKSVVRAMDAVGEILVAEHNVQLDKVMVAGASKRAGPRGSCQPWTIA